MNINDIKAQTQSGFARPNLFRLTFGNIAASKQPRFIINCFQAQIPGTNILTSDRDIGLRQTAYQRAYADMMIGFYCSGDMVELQVFQQWMDLIVNPRNNHMGYYSEYVSTVKIEQLSRESYTPPSNFNLNIRAKVKLGPVTLGLNTSNRTIPLTNHRMQSTRRPGISERRSGQLVGPDAARAGARQK